MRENEAELAKLFIPGPERPEAALRWRFQLIKKMGVFPHDDLRDALRRASKGTLDEQTKQHLLKIASSEEMLLDEVEKAMLFATALLLGSDKASNKLVLVVDRLWQILAGDQTLEEFVQKNPAYVECARSRQVILGEAYLKQVVPQIRAKLAFQEIVTALVPTNMVPLMVSISPKYLACPFTQYWIRHYQYHSLYSSGPIQAKARKCLASLSKSIHGDLRSQRKRRYPYWSVTRKYEELAQRIEGFRYQYRMKELDWKTFELFFSLRKIPESFKNRFLQANVSSKQLALEILTEQRLIDDPKSFRDFQSKVSKLKKKHSGAEIMLVVEDFLDLPTHLPEIFSKIEYLAVLEHVRL